VAPPSQSTVFRDEQSQNTTNYAQIATNYAQKKEITKVQEMMRKKCKK